MLDVAGTLTQIVFSSKSKGNHPTSITAAAPTATAAAATPTAASGQLNFERKDCCWDFLWSGDDPLLLVTMEKGRMYIYRDVSPEEPIMLSGYLCAFSDLEVVSASLDKIMRHPGTPTRNSLIHLETKALRDTREMLGTITTEDAYQFVENHSHPRLWRLLAEQGLHALDLPIVDKAFVRCGDYHGIQLAKKLATMRDNTDAQQAEVAAYFKNFEEAEAIYRAMDRMDLAIAMRIRLGDWFKVIRAQFSATL